MKPTLQHIKHLHRKFTSAKDVNDLCRKLDISANELKLHSLQPAYHVFHIPKANGKFRLIEDPVSGLKQIQRAVNRHLQAVYYLHQTEVAYGFIISVKNQIKKKNILQNAKQHLHHKYMLKIDLKDFFHQISKKRVYDLFRSRLFGFKDKLAHTLSAVLTYKSRLPMGAPTSPVLSNLCTIDLDTALDLWAKMHGITFTRFADDMTFSANNRITERELKEITGICQRHQYELNLKKTVFYDEQQTKKVTGLILNDTVDIEDIFYTELEEDLKRLKHLVEAGIIVRESMDNPLLVKMKQEVKGKINFIGMIEGYQSDEYQRYDKKLYQALHPDDEQLFIRWTHFNYL